MKISELIGQLTVLMVRHGDEEVTMGYVRVAGTPVRSVYADIDPYSDDPAAVLDIMIEAVDH